MAYANMVARPSGMCSRLDRTRLDDVTARAALRAPTSDMWKTTRRQTRAASPMSSRYSMTSAVKTWQNAYAHRTHVRPRNTCAKMRVGLWYSSPSPTALASSLRLYSFATEERDPRRRPFPPPWPRSALAALLPLSERLGGPKLMGLSTLTWSSLASSSTSTSSSALVGEPTCDRPSSSSSASRPSITTQHMVPPPFWRSSRRAASRARKTNTMKPYPPRDAAMHRRFASGDRTSSDCDTTTKTVIQCAATYAAPSSTMRRVGGAGSTRSYMERATKKANTQ
mmetsp:Transcript_5225/g.18797  ORF Transcript_5225/g.18797 Transcript_5225/m.18797 type:complete len:282 (-) Transcript_5225:1040-1885(-)